MDTHIIAERRPAKRGRPKARLLLVDDNKEFLGLLRRYFTGQGYEVLTAADGTEGLALARRRKPQVVILDVCMPRLDGMGMLRTLRQESQVPVIFLTGRHSDLDQVLGLQSGADDFVAKPVCAEALAARVEAVLRRAAGVEGGAAVASFGRLSVDPGRREVTLDGKALNLTVKEFDLLKALIGARGRVLSRDGLLDAVWGIGTDCDVRTRTVDQHVAALRQKLGAEGRRVVTVPRCGYRLDTA